MAECQTLPRTIADAFISEMTRRLGPTAVLSADDIACRSCDPFFNQPADAQLLLRPRSTDEVSFIMRQACSYGYTSVIHGGLTGVSGGAYTHRADLIVSLERMKKIEAFCPVTRTITAEAGVTIAEIMARADQHGLYYPIDIGSRANATLGGSLATNAGGNRTLRWGMTRDVVLGLEVVLADGAVISSMHKLVKNNTGYDLRQLFIGAEGTLGVITRAIVKLVPKPTTHDVAFLSVPDYDSVLEILNAAETLPTLSGFELLYSDFYEAVIEAKPGNVPIPPGDEPYYLLVETMGYHPATDRTMFEEFLDGIVQRQLAGEVILAQSAAQRDALWAVRESVDAVVRLLSPMRTFDISLEVLDIDDYVHGIRKALSRRFKDVRMIVNGHIGDNNIHLGISVGSETERHARDIDDIVYLPLAQFHGSMSAEHGIGTTKNDYLPITRSTEEIHLMRRIKTAVDPLNLLNPRVIFPNP